MHFYTLQLSKFNSLKNDYIIFMKPNRNCQSCGMPFRKHSQMYGTNADGSKNDTYCIICYENGKFTFNGNLKEFRHFLIEK